MISSVQKYLIVLLIGVALGMAVDRFIKLPIYLAALAGLTLAGWWLYKKKRELTQNRSNNA